MSFSQVKDDDDDTALIIGIVAAVIGAIGLVVLIVGCIVYKSKENYKVP